MTVVELKIAPPYFIGKTQFGTPCKKALPSAEENCSQLQFLVRLTSLRIEGNEGNLGIFLKLSYFDLSTDITAAKAGTGS